MGVYFAPKQTPWWAPLLGQLASDQIAAMGERTRMGKQVEDQRAFSGFLSEFAQGNPDASREDILLAALGSPHFARSGDMGKQALETMMVERERRRAEADMMGLGEDNLSIMKPLLYGSRMGIDQKVLGDTLFPDLVQRNLNLGDRFVGQMVNPRTGKVTGDSVSENIGMDPGTLAKLAQDRDQFNAEIGLKRQVAAQQHALQGREDPNRGGQWVVDDKGRNVFIRTDGQVIDPGVNAPAKSSIEGFNRSDGVRLFGSLGEFNEKEEKARGILLDWILSGLKGNQTDPGQSEPPPAGGGSFDNLSPEEVLGNPDAIKAFARKYNTSEEEVTKLLKKNVEESKKSVR